MTTLLNKPAGTYNWTNPSRPATDKEIDAMLNECEKSVLLSINEAEKLSRQKIETGQKRSKILSPQSPVQSHNPSRDSPEKEKQFNHSTI